MNTNKKFLVGITEQGDAGIHINEWVQKIDNMGAAILITKNPNDKFLEAAARHKNKTIIHLTCTGYGGTKLEPKVPAPSFVFEQYKKALKMGFRPQQFVLRVDPVIPTEKGLEVVKKILDMNMSMETPIKRVKVSFLDMYRHVEKRFEAAGLPHPYGKGVMHAPAEMQKAALELFSSYKELKFECCAETAVGYANIKQIGCISFADMLMLGMNPSLLDKVGTANQREKCMCPSNKTELLSHTEMCGHGCLYCYWRDSKKPAPPKAAPATKKPTAKLIVAGSRTFNDYRRLSIEIEDFVKLSLLDKSSVEIVTGGARGADKMAERYAHEHNMMCTVILPDWDKYGKSAGYRRNEEILEYASDADLKMLVAFWDGQSKGTKHMIDIAEKAGFEVLVINVNVPECGTKPSSQARDTKKDTEIEEAKKPQKSFEEILADVAKIESGAIVHVDDSGDVELIRKPSAMAIDPTIQTFYSMITFDDATEQDVERLATKFAIEYRHVEANSGCFAPRGSQAARIAKRYFDVVVEYDDIEDLHKGAMKMCDVATVFLVKIADAHIPGTFSHAIKTQHDRSRLSYKNIIFV